MAEIPFSRRRRGARARIEGNQFEQILVLQARMQGIGAFQMPLGARRTKGRFCTVCKRAGELFQIKTDYDWELIHNGVVVKVDCKSFDGETIPYSKIETHQVEGMKARQDHGVQGGYLVWFRPLNAVVWFNVDKLKELQPGQSLRPEDGEYLGGYEDFALGNLFL